MPSHDQILEYIEWFKPIHSPHSRRVEINPIPKDEKITVLCLDVQKREFFLYNTSYDKLDFDLFNIQSWISQEDLENLLSKTGLIC